MSAFLCRPRLRPVTALGPAGPAGPVGPAAPAAPAHEITGKLVLRAEKPERATRFIERGSLMQALHPAIFRDFFQSFPNRERVRQKSGSKQLTFSARLGYNSRRKQRPSVSHLRLTPRGLPTKISGAALRGAFCPGRVDSRRLFCYFSGNREIRICLEVFYD